MVGLIKEAQSAKKDPHERKVSKFDHTHSYKLAAFKVMIMYEVMISMRGVMLM